MPEQLAFTSLAQKLALWAEKLRDVSAMGLHFVENPYDRHNYEEVQTIAMELAALASGESLDALEPLRGTVYARPTPLVTGDGAVIDAEGRILLIQRADNGMWAMPGGAMEVGETLAEGIVREVREETGVTCEPVALVGVFDSRRCGSVSRHHMYHTVLLCRPLLDTPPAEPSHAIETLASGWFSAAALPEPIDPGHVSRIPVAFGVWKGEEGAFFDR